MGWFIQGWGWLGHGVKQPKNDSPWNQDLTSPKSFLEGVQNPSSEYNFFIITIMFIPNYIKKLLPDAPCIKITMA